MWLSDLFTARKQQVFHDLLVQQCDVLLDAAGLLERFFAQQDSSAVAAADVLDKRSDALLSQIIVALTDTFVTPFDRQDIYNLSEALDDMVDYLDNATREVVLFKVAPTPAMVEMARILGGAAADVSTAIRTIANDQKAAAVAANAASLAEEKVEDVYRRTVAELFDGPDFHSIFKMREIYRHLSNSADRADAIGKLIGKVVVKVA
jgi:uncharacterized protein